MLVNSETAAPTEKKRIAIFLDGTWNTVNDNTNVWRLRALCAPKGADGVDQAIYYNSGVGTRFGEKIRGGILGYGLNNNIIDAYQWLIERYNDGDELFIFGFSRGAYTARSLSGFISKCGLLEAGAPLSVNQLYARYRRANVPRTIRKLKEDQESGLKNFDLEEQWMLEYSRPVDIEFIGVWDTVGALGVPLAGVPGFGKADARFLNTGIRLTNKFAFHALAIDEHREAFAPTLWTFDSPQQADAEAVTPVMVPRHLAQVEQRWFVGAHANVGGGCTSDMLAQTPLKWIMDKAKLHGLAFKKDVRIEGVLDACPITDSYSEFMNGWYKRLTLGRRFYRTIADEPSNLGENSYRYPLNETIDGSVFERWRQNRDYRPPSLESWAKRKLCDISKLDASVEAASLRPVAS
ncbi:DUF2235 domain-containing protein [Bradyrhizobium sp. SZCCHNRI1073]|uniref:DUF2235 domain-containing protein n=1 Tax=Bradyrhizobium sp. SZCCHNRI1073 TaxID=3057280 RepID=UPI0029168BF8|nr:DUF2235 domain-containing protein [Bradyrhizobium sp. SZCCHNRI1073]